LNRTFALFLAIATLVAHALALHVDDAGNFAVPYERAHVAFRLARNLVQGGQLSWDGLTPGFDSYPSILWVGVAALAERAYVSVNMLCQQVGAVSSVLTVIVLAQFSRGRLAGVIAPLLFVFSNCAAAAAMSGTEAATVGLLVTISFLSFERRWRWLFPVAAALTCLASSEGVVFVGALFVLELFRMVREERPSSEAGTTPPAPSLLRPFLLPLATILALSGARLALTGGALSPWAAALLAPAPGQWSRGLDYAQDFLLGSGGTLLLVFPLWYLIRGSLSALGVRAFLLTVLWIAMTVLEGGGSLPSFQDMAPIVAVLYVSVQEAMTVSLDSRRKGLPQVTWVLFLLGLALSGLVSKYPGDLGPLPTDAAHRAWMEPRAQPPFGYDGTLGRLGLVEEIKTTERLRGIGIYLREQVDPNHSVLTPWPGAIGYLSRLNVIDVFGRASRPVGEGRTRPWTGRPRADVIEILERGPDYVVPLIRLTRSAPTLDSIAESWATDIDIGAGERLAAVRDELARYELVTVPFVQQYTRYGTFPRNRFYLLRRRDLDLAPLLHLDVDGRSFRVEVEHRSVDQIADLRVELVERGGQVLTLRPDGRFEALPDLLARSSLLLTRTGMRRFELVRGELPPGVAAVELRALLLNPRTSEEEGFAPACAEVRLRLP